MEGSSGPWSSTMARLDFSVYQLVDLFLLEALVHETPSWECAQHSDHILPTTALAVEMFTWA